MDLRAVRHPATDPDWGLFRLVHLAEAAQSFAVDALQNGVELVAVVREAPRLDVEEGRLRVRRLSAVPQTLCRQQRRRGLVAPRGGSWPFRRSLQLQGLGDVGYLLELPSDLVVVLRRRPCIQDEHAQRQHAAAVKALKVNHQEEGHPGLVAAIEGAAVPVSTLVDDLHVVPVDCDWKLSVEEIVLEGL